MLSNGSERAASLVNDIVTDYTKILDYFAKGDLLTILNSTAMFSVDEIHSLISSFNEYKENSKDLIIPRKVLILILNSTFMSVHIEPIIKQYLMTETTAEQVKIMLLFVLNFLELLPNQSMKKMALLYPSILFMSQQYPDDGSVKILSEQLGNSLSKMRQGILLSNATKNDQTKFRHFSTVPQYSDIFSVDNFRIDESEATFNQNTTFESVEHYLETQFLLLKELYLGPLKHYLNAVRERMMTMFQLNLKTSDHVIYENVSIEDLYPLETGVVYRVYCNALNMVRNFKCEKFKFGSLLCFTNNSFETIFFATVVDSFSKEYFLVQFFEDPLHEVISNNQFVMIETKIRVDAYMHILKKYQTLNPKSFPFQDYFVFGRNISKSFGFVMESIWSSLNISSDGEIDETEREIICNGLKTNLCLINDRRGSEKTYISLKIIDSLITRNIWSIVVVFYSNKTLDQYLGELIKSFGAPSIVRVGGSGKHECNISDMKWEWVKQRKFPGGLFARYKKNLCNINVLKINLVRKFVELRSCSNRVVSFNNLKAYMKESHVNYFTENDFNSWVLNIEDKVQKYSAQLSVIIEEECEVSIDGLIRDTLFDIVVNILDNDLQLDDEKKGSNDVHSDFENDCERVNKFRIKSNLLLLLSVLKTIDPITEEEYQSIDTCDVGIDLRLKLYKYWFIKYRTNLLKEYKNEKMEYENFQKESEQITLDEYFIVMKSAKVIVMTTFVAAKYSSLIERLGSRVVVVEEAQNVPEAHVICSLSKHCQQLIMIGNHDPLNIDADNDVHRFGPILFNKLIANKCMHYTLKGPDNVCIEAKKVVEHCGYELSCGHICPLPSHSDKPSHYKFRCEQSCAKFCARGLHQCKLLCCDKCKNQCGTEVIVMLDCCHEKTIECYRNDKLEKCSQVCTRLLVCGHSMEYYCGDSNTTYRCGQECGKTLACGHMCPRKCYEDCVCDEVVEKSMMCGHQKMLKCLIDPLDSLCVIIIERVFNCGHKVKFKCFEQLTKCNTAIDKKLSCGHCVTIQCGSDTNVNIVCNHQCNVKLNCGHKCRGVCNECYLGRFHVDCQRKCQKTYGCGHQCHRRCHPSLCPPCNKPCPGFCKHSTCSSECGDRCRCVVCNIRCNELFACVTCNLIEKCSKKCGVSCNKLCTKCSLSGTFQNDDKTICCCQYSNQNRTLKPKFEFKDHETRLKCQTCGRFLSTPYIGEDLLYFKRYSAYFKPFPESIILKWSSLLQEMKSIPDLSHDTVDNIIKEMRIKNVTTTVISRVDISFSYYEQITKIFRIIFSFNNSTKLGVFVKNARTLIFHLIKWLNPFVRHFKPSETYIFDLEKSKLELLVEVLDFLNSTSVSAYGLVHRQCFDLLGKLPECLLQNQIVDYRKEFDSIKNILSGKGDISPEEEELAEKIKKSKNICLEFGISSLKTEDKLKEIKNLIRRCHPDKNKSLYANEAVQILYKLRKQIEKQIKSST